MSSNQDPQAHKLVAVVTGGANGIGLAISKHFALLNYIVIVFDIDKRSPTETVELVKGENQSATVLFQACDVSSWEDLERGFKTIYVQFGRIDIVVANAGIAEIAVPSEMSRMEDEPVKPDLKVMDVNLMGVVFTVKLASHYMSKKSVPTGQSKGSIICTASMAGIYPFPLGPLYSTAKFGVVGLVRSMGPVLAKQCIQINALAPTVIDTNIFINKSILTEMRVTPASTLIRAVMNFLENREVTGEVAEAHGENVTLRPPHEIIDEHEKHNLEVFASRA